MDAAECRLDVPGDSDSMARTLGPEYFILSKKDIKRADTENVRECFGYDDDPFAEKEIYSFLELASAFIWALPDPTATSEYIGPCADMKVQQPLVCFKVGYEIFAVDAQTKLPLIYIFGDGHRREYFSDYRQLFGARIPFTVTDDEGDVVHILSIVADDVTDFMFSSEAYCNQGAYVPAIGQNPELRLLPHRPTDAPTQMEITIRLDKDGHVRLQGTNWTGKHSDFAQSFADALIRAMKLTPPKGNCGPVDSTLHISVDFMKERIEHNIQHYYIPEPSPH